MKAQTKSFNMRVRVAGLSSQNVDEFLSAAPSMQPQCSVERARVRHLARHPEVNLNLQTMVGILNKSSNQALHYSPAHLYLLMSRSSCNKGRKVNTGVHKCAYWNHLEVARVTPRTLIDLDYKDEHIKLQHYFQSSRFALTSLTVLTNMLRTLAQSQIFAHWGRRKISTRLTWCEPSDPNKVRLQRRAYQMKALK